VSAVLLDTHCLLWIIAAPERIGKKAQAVIESSSTVLWLSSASLFEIAVKYSLGKLSLPAKPIEYLPAKLDVLRIRELAVTSHHAYRVAELAWHHRDPFDRLLLAQSLVEKMPLMTADDQLLPYKAKLIDARR
jgi:PIN domain nuclease of toxin-antitoxin system